MLTFQKIGGIGEPEKLRETLISVNTVTNVIFIEAAQVLLYLFVKELKLCRPYTMIRW